MNQKRENPLSHECHGFYSSAWPTDARGGTATGAGLRSSVRKCEEPLTAPPRGLLLLLLLLIMATTTHYYHKYDLQHDMNLLSTHWLLLHFCWDICWVTWLAIAPGGWDSLLRSPSSSRPPRPPGEPSRAEAERWSRNEERPVKWFLRKWRKKPWSL